MIKIIALFGKSGAGKDYLLNRIINSNSEDFQKIVSYTTRPKRDNEEFGKDYYFVSEETFTDMILEDKFLEASSFREWCYGTPKTSLSKEKINVGIFNPEGIETILFNKNDFEEKVKILPVFVDCPDKERMIRVLEREESPDVMEIFRRYRKDLIDFSEFNFSGIQYSFNSLNDSDDYFTDFIEKILNEDNFL